PPPPPPPPPPRGVMSSSTTDRRTVWLARAGTLLIRVLASTWRVHWVNDRFVRDEHARGQKIIYILWHGELLPLLWAHRGRDIALMVSEHRDGEILARIAVALGYRLVRGSSSRGAARALLVACRELDSGFDMAVTPDGPRGPARSVASGAAVIANRSGAPMVPVAAFARRAWRLRSWDRFMIPKPFARIVVAYADPVRPRPETSRDAADDQDRVRNAIDAAGGIAAGT
ncbi:MAG: lysophospholipid acyltransferase family protein, partial [Gemmatimonadaceae bacterium]